MQYQTISFTHKNSTLEVRGALAFANDDEKISFIKSIRLLEAIKEIVLISTCNRCEIFCVSEDFAQSKNHILNLLSAKSNIEKKELENIADVFEKDDSIYHLFNVASSLDSLVVGETQIAGQIKDAHKISIENGFSSKQIAKALDSAFRCAANVRNASNISSNPVSIASVAVNLAKKSVDNIEEKSALIIGSGEMSVLSIKYLKKLGVDICIINRTYEKAKDIADELEISCEPYEKLDRLINVSDMIFTSTGSPVPIITDQNVKHRPFHRYWFDMAVPKDIEISNDEDISVFYIDDLKDIVDENKILRDEEAKIAYSLVLKSSDEFIENFSKSNVEPLIKELYLRAQECAKDETNRVIKAGYIPQKYEESIEKMANQTLKRFLYTITKNIRKTKKSSSLDTLIETLEYIIKKD